MPTSRRIVDQEGEDFYPTPEWATRALIANEKFSGNIWEPACGNGAMSEVLRQTGLEILSTDLFDRGYGTRYDFLNSQNNWDNINWDNIITNPPYNLAEDFVSVGLRTAKYKLALLLRLSFLESGRRFNSIFSKIPPTRIWVFSERITFYPNGVQTGGTGTLAYAWFVWDKENKENKCELKWIAPGFKTDSRTGGSAIEIEL